jgi:SAM-dependent methyltransferase
MEKAKLIGLFNERGRRLKQNRRIIGSGFRERLLVEAKGKTLEVAVGAGANFGFYPKTVDLVAVDFSPVLLKIAAESAKVHDLKVSFLESDVESLSFGENTFDTIVSTLTLCAYEDPLQVLHNFNRWCKADGKILLFEHGIGSNQLLNWLLNKADNWNLNHNGCHLNLDLQKLLSESGLIIETMQRAILGAVYLIKARPGKASRNYLPSGN